MLIPRSDRSRYFTRKLQITIRQPAVMKLSVLNWAVSVAKSPRCLHSSSASSMVPDEQSEAHVQPRQIPEGLRLPQETSYG